MRIFSEQNRLRRGKAIKNNTTRGRYNCKTNPLRTTYLLSLTQTSASGVAYRAAAVAGLVLVSLPLLISDSSGANSNLFGGRSRRHRAYLWRNLRCFLPFIRWFSHVSPYFYISPSAANFFSCGIFILWPSAGFLRSACVRIHSLKNIEAIQNQSNEQHTGHKTVKETQEVKTRLENEHEKTWFQTIHSWKTYVVEMLYF